MYHNDYINAVKEYLRRYNEFCQYIDNVKADIADLQALKKQEAAAAVPTLSPTGGCSGGQSVSVEERAFFTQQEIEERIAKYQHELQQIEPLVKRLQRSLDSLGASSETDRRIIQARYIDDLSWERTAEYAHASYGYCRSRERKVLQTLTGMMFGPSSIPMQGTLLFLGDCG